MKSHWENIYEKKEDQEVSWYQEKPITSLNLMNKYTNSKDESIIDVGAGNSNLVIELLNSGYNSLTALDISSNALKRTQEKLGEKANDISWVASDILNYSTSNQFKLWHDRAVFHFLTSAKEVNNYINIVYNNILNDGYFILSTFSKDGPLKCSGLEISQYNEVELIELFRDKFELVESFTENHVTPFNTNQDFIWVVFWKK